MIAPFAVVLMLQAQAQADDTAISLKVGEQQTISSAGVKSYSEGLPGIADVRLTNDQKRFVIVGRREGQTSLLLIKRDGTQEQYSITVSPTSPTDRAGAVGKRYNIRLDLYFVLLSEDYSHQIGIGWPSTTTGSVTLNTSGPLPGSPTTNWSLGLSSVLPRLDMAQTKGWVKIYRQAALITANNTEAEFKGGGEVNIAVVNNQVSNIQAIEYGTKLSVIPHYDPQSRRIELEVGAELADLSAALEGVPGRLISTIKTVVNLELGQSVVLGGLSSRSMSKTRDGFPGLSQVPFVGALFGSHGKLYKDSETLIFMVPSLVSPVSIQARNRVDEAIRVYEKFKGGVDDRHLIEGPNVSGSN
ncbi:MAG: pilus assembly protein N-terminal domain-containing protein [Polyangiales bacterium]